MLVLSEHAAVAALPAEPTRISAISALSAPTYSPAYSPSPVPPHTTYHQPQSYSMVWLPSPFLTLDESSGARCKRGRRRRPPSAPGGRRRG